MQSPFFLFWVFWVLLLSHPPSILSRRSLHQQLPISTPSPSPTPSLPPPPTPPAAEGDHRYKVSSVAAPVNPPPFFPSYTSAPPPPPPTRFISFPANISTLVVPHTPSPKPSSGKLVAAVVSVVITVAVLAGVVFFLYRRRKGERRKFASDSEDGGGEEVYALQNEEKTASSYKFRAGGSNSTSEFLYLGNFVNSGVVEESSGSGSGKQSSPELRPLPPLPRQQCEEGSVEEEEEEREDQEEEFYSPTASLCGRESSIGAESGFPAQKSGAGGKNESSDCSCSSSGSGSPARSSSSGMASPRRSEPKSPERVSVSARNSESSQSISYASNRNLQSPTLSLPSTSPDLSFVNKRYVVFDQTTRSSVSSFSTSPDRGLARNPNRDGSLRILSYLQRNARSPLPSSASITPFGRYVETPSAYLQCSSIISSASTSPDRGFRKTLDQSPPKLHDPSRDVRSVLLSLASSSSQQRDTGDDPASSSRNSNQESFWRTDPSLKRSVSAPPRRPPPPPPPARRRVESQSTVGFPAQPPPLIPPSRPFVAQNNPRMGCSTEIAPSSGAEEAMEETPRRKARTFRWERARGNSSSGTAWGHHLRSSSYV